MPEPWTIVESRVTYEDPWLRVRSDRCAKADGRLIEPFHVLEYPGWLNILALTAEGRVLLVREYRHGVAEVLTGLPSGTMERGEADPEAAARRELREETGFTGGHFHALMPCYANPANQTNRVYPFLAVGVRATDAPTPDPDEEIEVLEGPFLPFLGRVWRGELPLQASHVATVHLACDLILTGGVDGLDALRADLRAEVARRYALAPAGPAS